jgi:hypothetical protein
LLTWLPTFVNKGLGVDYSMVGWLAMIPHVTSFFFYNIAGNLADRMIRGGMDVAPKYAGTLMGLTNTAGTVPGVIGVFVSGLILEVTGSWALVFQVTAGITLFGLAFYLLFSSGRRLID